MTEKKKEKSKTHLLTGRQIAARAREKFKEHLHREEDPSAWDALFYDRSVPFDHEAKAVYLAQCASVSRQFALPLLRPLCRIAMTAVAIFKTFFPNLINSPRTLHYLIYLGQKYFVSPEANYLILRHFHVGTRVIRFLSANLHKPNAKLHALEPVVLEDIYRLNLYLQHDINLFNFIIGLNLDMRSEKTAFAPNSKLNTSMIDLDDFGIRELPDRWCNFLDCETAIELYTPIFYFFLRDTDFWRSSHSLQFDETMAVYLARVLGTGSHMPLVNNKHPMAPRPGYESAYRLVLHGIASEHLYGMLAAYRRRDDNPDQMLPMHFDNQLVFNK